MGKEVRNVGFMGLGDIGLPMAKCIVTKGYGVTVCAHKRREPVEELKKLGANEAKTPKAVAQVSDVIITMVPDDVTTAEVLFGPEGALEGAKENSGILLMNTVSPAFCRKVSEAAKTKKVDVLDAPVVGTRMRAATGELAISVGGEKEILEKYRPVLETMGKIVYCGDLGMGQIVKLVNQMVAMIQTFGTYEAVCWGVKNGASEELLIEHLKNGSGNNWGVQNWEYVKSMWTVPPPRTFYMGAKDLGYALHIGHEIEQPCPIAAICWEIQKAGPPDLSKLQKI
jgi:3-hydroxyisobutyrate dehydrogenase-like beta-hydroxyacid dehydrogenase